MLSEIEVFNVRFGDCFMFKSFKRNAAMLVDFGSMQAIDKYVKQKVNYELSNVNEKSLMITHFHLDHYKGISALNNQIKFNNIYLPNFFTKSMIRLHLALLTFLSPSHPAYMVAMNLLSVIPNLYGLLNNSSIIHYVKRGERICNRTDAYRILWPDISKHDQIADELYDDIIKFYNISDNDETFEKLTHEYIGQFPKVETIEGDSVMRFHEMSPEQMSRVRSLIKETLTAKKERKRLSSILSNRITNFQNELCICFDNFVYEYANNDKYVLFLSDITPENFDIMSITKDGFELLPEYRIIKAAHHGTRDYFINNLPESEYIIISNGNRKGWPITPLYGDIYADRKLVCTNYNKTCEYDKSGKRCIAYYPNLKICPPHPKCISCTDTKCICGINGSHQIKL